MPLPLEILTSDDDAACRRRLLGGFVALVAMQAVYWMVTHPVNRFWLKHQHVQGLAGGFFSFDLRRRHQTERPGGPDEWETARDRWEYSHVVRAVIGAAALIALQARCAVSIVQQTSEDRRASEPRSFQGWEYP